MRQILFRIISVVCLLIPHFVNAQSDSSLGVMYKPAENPVKIETFGIPIPELSVTAQGGTVILVPDGWRVRPTNAIGETVELIVSTKNRILYTKSYEIKPFPAPNAYIAYKDATGSPCRYRGRAPISKALLLNADGIGIELGGDSICERYFPQTSTRIFRFAIRFQSTIGDLAPEYSTDNKFTDKQKELIRKLRKGDRFWIIYISMLSPDSLRRMLPDIEVIVD